MKPKVYPLNTLIVSICVYLCSSVVSLVPAQLHAFSRRVILSQHIRLLPGWERLGIPQVTEKLARHLSEVRFMPDPVLVGNYDEYVFADILNRDTGKSRLQRFDFLV